MSIDPKTAELARALLTPQNRIDQGFAALAAQRPMPGVTPQMRIDQGFAAPEPASMAVDWGYVPKPGAFPQGQPTPQNAQAAMQPQQQPVPMPMPRPQEAPQPQQDMSWFMRNAHMQRDPMSGEFLDPRLAALAQQQG